LAIVTIPLAAGLFPSSAHLRRFRDAMSTASFAAAADMADAAHFGSNREMKPAEVVLPA
jgi:hypothetical protein